MNLEFSVHPLLQSEYDAYQGMVQNNKHCSVTVLPNHFIDDNEIINGFVFRSNPENLSSIS